MINKTMKQIATSAGLAACLLAPAADAANWLMLQGTEQPGAAGRAKVWGFIQPEFSTTSNTLIQGGAWAGNPAIFNQQRPNLKTNRGFNNFRSRIGVRGTGMPLDSNVNYFLLGEFGNNGITAQGGGSVKVTDASVTLNHIPGARIRVGQFKTPGSEEGLQAIHVFDYINFTNATNGLLLERFFNGNGSGTFVKPGPASATSNANDSGDANRPNGPVGAFRDVGIQVFDTFKKKDWEHSYAVMIGNGNGITRGDNDNNMETYLYWASEQVYGGKGARRQGLKMYIWNQDGKRTLTTEGAGEYDRTRTGIGATYKRGKIRGAFEYITADGMIFNGTDGAAVAGTNSSDQSAKLAFGTDDAGADGFVTSSFNMETKGEADGMYLHFGYAITPKLELDARYDVYNRMTDNVNKERQFETITLGAQYFFNKKSRVIANYEMRDASSPSGIGASTAVTGSIDDRISAQLLIIF